MSEYAISFTHAVTRKPAHSITQGLRAVDIGAPDWQQFHEDHTAYCEALRATGAKVTELEALESFPDSVFVEDTALCLPEGCILMRPGVPSREGEVASIRRQLEKLYSCVHTICKGHIEGGDILVTGKEILVGTSTRTNSEGIVALRKITEHWGYQVRQVRTPKDVLHFKTDCCLLDTDTILASARLAATGCFNGYQVIETAAGEEACANSIRVNDWVIMPAGFPKTRSMLQNLGFRVKTINNSEAAKIDGGMSCMSLRCSFS